VEDPRLLVVVPEITTTLMTIEALVKDTTIEIMTIPAKIEMAEATSTMLAEDNLVNKIIMTIMITNLATKTEDPGEMTTIRAIVLMKNTRDLLETTDPNHLDSTTTTTRAAASREASKAASEEETAMTVASSEETAEETSVGHPEETSEVATLLEDLAASADRAVETMALEELVLTNNEKGIF